jgi:Diguanylate cyclase, GGDEF domain/FHA domain
MTREDAPETRAADTKPVLSRLRRPPRADVPLLRVVAGRNLLRFVTLLPGQSLVMGRDEDCPLALEDDSVSRRHARATCRKDGSVAVMDLRSTNGTSVNGRPVERTTLAAGDRVQLGDVCLRYELVSSDEVAHLRRVAEHLRAKDHDTLTGLLTRGYLVDELPEQVERCRQGDVALSCIFLDIDHFKAINDRYGHAVGDDVLVSVTVSIGVALRKPAERDREWLDRADRALYAAKHAGRNRVWRASRLGS